MAPSLQSLGETKEGANRLQCSTRQLHHAAAKLICLCCKQNAGMPACMLVSVCCVRVCPSRRRQTLSLEADLPLCQPAPLSVCEVALSCDRVCPLLAGLNVFARRTNERILYLPREVLVWYFVPCALVCACVCVGGRYNVQTHGTLHVGKRSSTTPEQGELSL